MAQDNILATPAFCERNPSQAEIRKALGLLCVPGEVYELRVLEAKQGTIGGYYDDLDALARHAYLLTTGEAQVKGRYRDEKVGEVKSVYTTINPVQPYKLDLVEPNDFRVVGKEQTQDSDVLRRKRILVDCDPFRPSGVSSTDSGWANALQRAEDIRGHLLSLGFPPMLLASSGNGGHVQVGCDLPNDDESRELVKAFLGAIDSRFGDRSRFAKDQVSQNENFIDVDTKVYNSARICTLYGTWKRKGANRVVDRTSNPARPHRLAGVLDAPVHLDAVPVELIRRVIQEAEKTTSGPPPQNGKPVEEKPVEEKPVSGEEETGFGKADWAHVETPKPDDKLRPARSFDLEATLKEIGVLVSTKVDTEKGFTYYQVRECPFDPTHKRATLSQHASGTVTYLCPHKSCRGEKEGFTQKTAREYFRHYDVEVPERSSTRDGEVKQETGNQPPPSDFVDVLSFRAAKERAASINQVFLVQGWLQAGHLVVFSGREKRGKSTAMYDLILSVCTGTHWMGLLETRQAPVLLMDYENSIKYVIDNLLGMIQGRSLDEAGLEKYFGQIDPDRIRDLAFPLKVDYALSRIRHMEERTGARRGLFVIDTATPAFMGMFEDPLWTNNNVCVRSALELGQKIARETNWTVIVVYHDNRAGTGAAGSYEWCATPDAFIRWERELGQPIARMSFAGRVIDPPKPVYVEKTRSILRARPGGHEETEFTSFETFLSLVPVGDDKAISRNRVEDLAMQAGFTRKLAEEYTKRAITEGTVNCRKGPHNATLVWRV